MLETVAPEASYVKISGQIYFKFTIPGLGKIWVSPTPSPGMVFSFLKIKISRSGDTIRTAGVLGALGRVLRGSCTGLGALDVCQEDHGRQWSGLWMVSEMF